MSCVDIGKADADIAGIGVVTAFVFQAVASWVLSGILDVFMPDPLQHKSLRSTRAVRRDLFSLASLYSKAQKIERDLARSNQPEGSLTQLSGKVSALLAALREETRTELQTIVETNKAQELSESLVEENIHEDSPRQEARSVVADILYSSSDAQTLAGKQPVGEVESVPS